MKPTTLALLLGGLLFVAYFQLPQQPPPEATSAAAVAPKHARPHGKPVVRPAAARSALTFGGYPCPGECTEEKAGYRWAEEKSITDPDDCTGDTSAFIEGCRVHAQQQAAAITHY